MTGFAASVAPVRYTVGWLDAVLFGLFPVVIALILWVRHKARQERESGWEAWDEEGNPHDIEIEEPDSVDEIDDDYDTDVRRF